MRVTTAMPDPDHVPPVAAAVITRPMDGRIVLVRRRVPEGDLSWQFPAGKVEAGESPEEAAVREAREEVGLNVSGLVRIGARDHPLTGRRIVYVACAFVSGAAGVAAPREIAYTAWVPPFLLDTFAPGVYEPVRRYLGLGRAKPVPGPSRRRRSPPGADPAREGITPTERFGNESVDSE
ncbi:NUDIX hydrolase [Streptomyces sp. NPDC094448]|uniref:NUDIX hydrolase n=1 Tax=Streptomyces sp. NPDC094448 TaxID=3366063 RepID=UPI0038092385